MTDDQKNQLVEVCRKFIHTNNITCPEACVSDAVYENAPDLVDDIAKIVGYFEWPRD